MTEDERAALTAASLLGLRADELRHRADLVRTHAPDAGDPPALHAVADLQAGAAAALAGLAEALTRAADELSAAAGRSADAQDAVVRRLPTRRQDRT